MTNTLRKIRAEASARGARGDCAARKRQNAVNAARAAPGITVRALAKACDLSAPIAQRVKNAASRGDEKELEKLLSPHKRRRGRRPVLTPDERALFTTGINRFSIDGSIPSEGVIRAAMSQMPSDGRKNGFKSELPCKGSLLCFRATHEEAAYRRNSSKEIAKTHAEQHDHVKTCVGALEDILAKHPSLRANPEAIINIDETDMRAMRGERSKPLAPASARAGASRPSFIGSDKHVTAAIAASAAGRIAPPFFAVAGKSAMTSWAQPLREEIFQLGDDLARRQREDWLDQNAAALTTPNGSMEKTTIHLVIDHIHRFFRKLAPPDEPLLALLDGHSSRKGLLWLIKAVECGIEAAKSPASASHFLQPCDDAISKKLKARARKARDISLQRSIGAGAGAAQFKLICGSHALRCLPSADISTAFESAGIWPMSMRLLRRFFTPHKKVTEDALLEKKNLEIRPKARSLARQKDSDARSLMLDILSNASIGPTSAAQKASALLSSAKAASSVIFGKPGSRSRSNTPSKGKKHNSKKLPGEQESGGAPALRMAHRERLDKPRADEEEQEMKRKWRQLARDAARKVRCLRAERKRIHGRRKRMRKEFKKKHPARKSSEAPNSSPSSSNIASANNPTYNNNPTPSNYLISNNTPPNNRAKNAKSARGSRSVMRASRADKTSKRATRRGLCLRSIGADKESAKAGPLKRGSNDNASHLYATSEAGRFWATTRKRAMLSLPQGSEAAPKAPVKARKLTLCLGGAAKGTKSPGLR